MKRGSSWLPLGLLDEDLGLYKQELHNDTLGLLILLPSLLYCMEVPPSLSEPHKGADIPLRWKFPRTEISCVSTYSYSTGGG